MTHFLFGSFQPLKTGLLSAMLGCTAAACDAPTRQPPAATPGTATAGQPAASAAPAAEYSIEPIMIKRDKTANLTVQVTYPALRPRPGTAPADTVGIAAFNHEAKALATGLVKEIEATARENRRDKTPTALQVSFRPYLLQAGLVSVAFTINQDGIGPRPITWATGLTYDLRTGRKLMPADIFQQNNAFKAAVLNTLEPLIAGNDDCNLEIDNMAWDNFVLSPEAYQVLLGDAQIGRPCGTRAVVVPLSKLKPYASAKSPAERLSTENR